MIELGVSAGIDLAGYRRIVAGEALVPAESAYERVAAARASFERHLARGGSAYGVTTGLGYLTSAAVGDADQAALQRSLVTARASGLGAPLPAEVVRGAMTLRLNGFLSGHAVVTPDLCRFIAARINEGWAPVVPAGPYGAAGEIGPLAHLFQTLIGEGLVTEGDEIVPAGEALARAGVAPYELQPKEGLALIDGSPFATALAVHVVDRGARLLRQAGRAAALSIAVTGASTRSLSPASQASGGIPRPHGSRPSCWSCSPAPRCGRTARKPPSRCVSCHRCTERCSAGSRSWSGTPSSVSTRSPAALCSSMQQPTSPRACIPAVRFMPPPRRCCSRAWGSRSRMSRTWSRSGCTACSTAAARAVPRSGCRAGGAAASRPGS